MVHITQITEDIYQFDPEPDLLSSAVFFLKGPQSAIIETGPGAMVPNIMEGMEKVGGKPGAVSHVIVTHVHMDHAGGLGTLMKLLPQAQAVVHKEGARHALDPSKLIAGTKMSFGEDFHKRFGAIEPVPQARLVAISGGETFSVNGRELKVFDAPGHAPHHLAVFDSGSKGLFAGEALGMYLAGSGVVLPGVAAPAYDQELALATIDRLEALHPQIVFYSHQGSSRDVARLIPQVRRNVVAFGEIILRGLKEKAGPEEISGRLVTYLREEGFPIREIDPKWGLMLQGYEVYFRRRGLV